MAKSPPSKSRLEIIKSRIAVEGLPMTTLFSAALHNQMHVFSSQPAQYLALNQDGVVSHQLGNVPAALIEGVTTCNESLILLNGDPERDSFEVLAVEADDTISWRQKLPVARSAARYPHVLCVDNAPTVVWTTGQVSTTITIMGMENNQKPSQIKLDEMSFNVHVVAADTGITVTRLRGTNDTLEVVRMVDGKITAQTTLLSIPVADAPLLHVDGRYGVLLHAKDGQRLYVQQLDEALQPVGEPVEAVKLEDGQILSAQWLHGAQGQVAVSYVETHDAGDWVMTSSNRSRARHQRRQTQQQTVLPYDMQHNTPGIPQIIESDGLTANTSCWLGNQLYVLHGTENLALTIYAYQR